jgi:cytochrome c oxidase cbb3-type subunit III
MKMSQSYTAVVLCFLGSLLGGCLEETPLPTPSKIEMGLQVYQKYCGFCHGEQGEGYISPAANALSNQDFLKAANDSFLKDAIDMGRPGTKMSAWSDEYGGPLSASDVDNLTAAIRSWQIEPSDTLGGGDSTGVPELGAAPYAKECAICHGEEGEGTSIALSLNNPVFLASASDAFLRHALTVGRRDTGMKSYAGILTSDETENIIALIRSWQKPIDLKKITESNSVPVVMNPDGPEPDFELGAEFIGVDIVKAEMDKGARFILIDARPTSDYAFEHITGAYNIPFFDIDTRLDEIPEDTWVISYCACPHDESGIVAKAIRDNGHPKVAVLDEGFIVWMDKDYPVTTTE